MSCGLLQPLTGLCLMFLRPNAARQITADNIANEVNFMTMDCSGGNLLQGLDMMINKIFAPALRAQEVKYSTR